MSSLLQQLLDETPQPGSIVWVKRRLQVGDTVFNQGDTGREVYIVRQGVVQVIGDVPLESGSKLSSGIFDLGPGAIFGELALFDRKPRSATVKAITEAELAVIDGDALLLYFERHPEVGYAVLKEMMTTMIERLRRTNQKLFSLFAWGLKARDIERHIGQ